MAKKVPIRRICDACLARKAKEPQDYLAWQEWAEKKSRRYEQVQCPDCGRWSIWKRKARADG